MVAPTSIYGDNYDLQVNRHTDTLNESGFIESESLSWASGGNITFHRYERVIQWQDDPYLPTEGAG